MTSAFRAFSNLDLSLSLLAASVESRESATAISSSDMDETAALSNIKIPSDRWEASRGKGYRQTTRPGPPPNRL